MKTTPKWDTETITFLEPKDDKRQQNPQTSIQIERVYQVFQRMNGMKKGRLKRKNFAALTKTMVNKDQTDGTVLVRIIHINMKFPV